MNKNFRNCSAPDFNPGLLLTICVTGLFALSAHAAAQIDPAADIEAQYQSALATLKKPPVGGVLVTEVGPESGAAAAGMRAGDIITELYGTKITTLQALREQVAEAIAKRLDDASAGNRVLARIRRGNDEKLLQLPREPLDIRAVEVEANVPGPRNPPPNLRGTLVLDWKAVAEALQQDAETGSAFRTFARNDQPGGADEEWIGWQICKVSSTDGDLQGSLEWHRITEITGNEKEGESPKTEQTTVTFRLSTGDYKTAPAFVLNEVAARYPGDAGTVTTATAKRIGERLQATIVANAGGPPAGPAPAAPENAAPLTAIPEPALPWVAAALPHEKDAALGLNLLSLRDLQSRPGYVLVARAMQTIPADPAQVLTTEPATAPATQPATEPPAPPAIGWRVDLVHFGVVIESYWFSDQRRLLAMQAQGVHSIISRRAIEVREASLPMVRKPASLRTVPAGATQP